MGGSIDCCSLGLFSPQSDIDDPMDYRKNKFRKVKKKKINRDNIDIKIIELNEKYKSKSMSLLIECFIKNKFDTFHYDLKNKHVFKKNYIDYYLTKSIENSNVKSFIAINKKNEKEVVGILICDNYLDEMDEKAKNELQTASHSVEDNYKKIFALKNKIKQNYNKINNINKDNNKIFEFKFSAVSIDYHRLGIGTKLKQFALKAAKKLSYNQCISIALNNQTIELNKKLGFKEEISIKYFDFEHENQFPFRSAVDKTNDQRAVLMQINL